jgi:uncharacterized protein YgiM (DUF1202 family)
MKDWGNLRGILPLILILTLVGACNKTRPQTPAAYYFVTTEITYLRDGPGYESNVVAQLYKGDQVERLDVKDSGWWRVRSGRTDQMGWIQGELLSPDPVEIVYYYVTLNTVKLRECPQDDCPALQLLYRGDEVQKIEQNDLGWWRVLAAKSRSLGWLPAAAVVERLGESQAQKPGEPYYYVAVPRLKLRLEPLPSSKVIKILGLNDQVELLEKDPSGWNKVRQPSTGAVGWVAGRYLEALPVKAPRRSGPAKKKAGLPQPEKKGEPLPEPEAM